MGRGEPVRAVARLQRAAAAPGDPRHDPGAGPDGTVPRQACAASHVTRPAAFLPGGFLGGPAGGGGRLGRPDGRGPDQPVARLGRPHDLGRPGPLDPRRGDGGRPGPARALVVRDPSAVSGADAARAGGRAGAVPPGRRRPRLSRALRRLPPGLPGAALRRRPAVSAGAGRRHGGGADGADRRGPPVPDLFPRGRRGERVQRPAARLLLRRRAAAPAAPPSRTVGGGRGGAPPRSRRARQERGSPARVDGAPARRRGRALAPPPARMAAAARPGGHRGGAGSPRARPPRLLALGHPQPVRRGVRQADLRRDPLARGRHPAPVAGPQDPGANAQAGGLVDLLDDYPGRVPRRVAGIAAARGPAARPRGARAARGRLAGPDRQPGGGAAGLDRLEPLPRPGVAPVLPPLCFRSGRSDPAGSTLQISAAFPS